MKKFLLQTTLLAIFVSTFTLVNAQTTSQKAELKPVTTPLKKESPRFTAVERPIGSSNKVTFTKVPNSKTGIRGTEIVGEGQYLNFDKQIRLRSVSGEIPVGFPKHIKGQSKKEYVEVMKEWAKNNPEKIKPVSDYLDYDIIIKSMVISNDIPEGFPKYQKGQTRKVYIQIMKDWAKQNINLFKSEYWTTINK